MVIGATMLTTEVAPQEVYNWFMVMYADSSDWVMGPNVFGMSQFSDGGIFATKPYICGSNYIRKNESLEPAIGAILPMVFIGVLYINTVISSLKMHEWAWLLNP